MYPLDMDYSRESGMVLIPTRFVWRYGGRIVYISGSFTGLVDLQLVIFVDVCFVPFVVLASDLSCARAKLLLFLMPVFFY